MTTWHRVAMVLAAAGIVGGSTYQLVNSIKPSSEAVVSLVPAVFVAVFVYVVAGLSARRFVGSEGGLPRVDTDLAENVFAAYSAAFLQRLRSGLLELVRLGAAVYFGAITRTLASNVFSHPENIRLLASAAGIATGIMTALVGLYWAYRLDDPSRGDPAL